MTRLVALVLLAAAACASREAAPPVAPPEVPGTVVLATFVAEADPGAGTIRFHVEPTPAGRVTGTRMTVPDADVAMRSSGGWVEPSYVTDRGCGVQGTWGADVWIERLSTGATYFAGLYAQVTDFTGGGGNTPCNGVAQGAAPDGVDASKGAWFQGTPVVSGVGPTVRWAFNWTSSTPFTFRGRVLGVKVFPMTPKAWSVGVLASNGSSVVFPTITGMAFLAGDGTVTPVDVTVDGRARVLVATAPDVGRSRIWFAGSNVAWNSSERLTTIYVGFTNGLGVLEIAPVAWNSTSYGDSFFPPVAIVPDLVQGNAAWLVLAKEGDRWTPLEDGAYTVRKVTTDGTSVSFAGAPFVNPFTWPSNAVAVDGRLYVTETSFSGNPTRAIAVWDGSKMYPEQAEGYLTIRWLQPSICDQGWGLLALPSGKVWMGGASAICQVEPDATFSAVVAPLPAATTSGETLSPLSLCLRTDSEVWYMRREGAVRVDSTGAVWTPQAEARDWMAVASDASGTRLLASSGAWLQTSTDAGLTWPEGLEPLPADRSADLIDVEKVSQVPDRGAPRGCPLDDPGWPRDRASAPDHPSHTPNPGNRS